MASANDAVRAVAAAAARQADWELMEVAFLDFPPQLPEAVARLVERGAGRVLVVPYFLTLGIHLQRDLPGIVADLSRIHHGMEIHVAEPLDGHPNLPQILVDRAKQWLSPLNNDSPID